MLAKESLTTSQIRARLCIAMNTTHALLLRIQKAGLIRHEVTRIDGRRQALWHIAEGKA
jgi:DNA-binding MarR family transcriptional regulator